MKNIRTKQTPIQRAMKIVTSITLLAMLFVLVLAGTLSGAFGVEENLVQNGSIQPNVASAAVAKVGAATTSGTEVRLENNHNGKSNVAYMLSENDFYTDSNFSKPNYGDTTGYRGWGFYSGGDSGNNKNMLLPVKLSDEVISALANGITIKVFLTATQRGSGKSDWGTMCIYSAIPSSINTEYVSTGWGGHDGQWVTLPDYLIANQDAAKHEWNYDVPSTKTIGGAIPSKCSTIYIGFHAIASGGWGIAWDDIKLTFTFESGVTITTDVGANGSISPAGTTYTITGTNDDKSVTATPNTGYHFTGWTYNGGTNRIDNVSQVGGAFSFNGSNIINGKTYTANFAINQLNVTYHTNLNGSNRDDGTKVFTYNSLGTSYLKSPEKLDGYTFVGWALSENGDVFHKYGENVGNTIANVDFSKAENHNKTVHLYAVWVASDFDIIAGGNKDNGTWGSASNPFAITTPQHLKNLSDIVNGVRYPVDSVSGTYYGQTVTTVANESTYANCYFVVTADINMTGVSFVAIGSTAHSFSAKQFDFQGFDILNLTVSGGGNIGLFGVLDSTNILSTGSSKDNPTVLSGTRTSTSDNVGSLVGWMNGGSISGYFRNECTVNGNGNFVGGIVGRNHSNIVNGRFFNYGEVVGKVTSTGGIFGFTGSQLIDSENHGDVTGVNAVGGIAGRNQGTITGCKNYGKVTSTANGTSAGGEVNNIGAAVGGISGYSNSDVTNCHNYGTISASNASAVGGILGVAGFYSNSSWTGYTLRDCTNNASITGVNYVGGIAGYANQSIFSNDSNLAGFTVQGTSFVGGIVGAMQNSSRVENSPNAANVNAQTCVGGIVGFISSNGTVSGSNNSGKITASGSSNDSRIRIGGIVGAIDGSGQIENCDNENEVSVSGGTYGVGGILGYHSGSADNAVTISNCDNKGTVVGRSETGGIVGYTDYATISDCNNTKAVSGIDQDCLGGIAGKICAGSIVNCINSAVVTGKNKVGGIIGFTNGIEISNIINSASVNGNEDVGGLIGHLEGSATITVSENSGAVNGYKHLGGFIGYAVANGTNIKLTIQGTSANPLKNSGAVTSTIPSGSSGSGGDGGIAGIVGYLDAGSNIDIQYCENVADIKGLQFNGVAGVLGYVKNGANSISITNSKNTAKVDGGINVGGLGGRVSTTLGSANAMYISHCYNSGAISGYNYTIGNSTQTGTIGGMFGYFNVSNNSAAVGTGVIEYCYNKGEILVYSSGLALSNPSNVGGIAGNALAGTSQGTTDTKGVIKIDYSYTDSYAGCNLKNINGTSGALVSSTSYVIVVGTNVNGIALNNGGSYLLFDGDTTVFDYPLVDGAQTTWENIVTQNINGFHLTTNVAAGDYYVSLNDAGVDGALLKPYEFTSTEKSGSYVITARYDVVNGNNNTGNIYIDTAAIELDETSFTYTYDAETHTIKVKNLPSGYAVKINCFDNADYSGTPTGDKINAGTYYTETFVKIDGKDVGRLADSTEGVLTINPRRIVFRNQWSDDLYENETDRSIEERWFIYNASPLGLKVNGVRTWGLDENNALIALPENVGVILDVTGSDLDSKYAGFSYVNAGDYFRRYTLKSTNYVIVNNIYEEVADGIVEFKWTIAKNKLTIDNVWTSDNIGGSPYTFVYNGQNQGVKNVLVSTQPDTKGNTHTPQASVYTIDQILYSTASFVKNVGEYSGIFTLNDTANYEIGTTAAYVDGVATANATGLDGVTRNGNVITYAWKINQFDIESAFNAANPQAWFGAGTNMVVANQNTVNTENVNGTRFAYYYLQAAAGDTPKVIVYQNDKYIKNNFVLYVKYTTKTNGLEAHRLVKLVYGTDYTIADLTTAGDKHVADATVTASGTGNFSGDAVKYYVVADSDFGGNINQANWGSASNPYVIENPVQMLRLSQIVNGGVAWNSINSTNTNIALAQNTNAVATDRDYRNAYFVVSESYTGTLAQTVGGTVGFEPIGSAAYSFKAASFAREGETNVTIEYSYSNTLREYAGFFGYIDGTYIHGIDFVGVGTVSASNYLGGIVGYANGGKIEDCTFSVSAAIQSRTISGKDHVGGLVGYANGTAIIHNSDTNDYGKLMQASVSGVNYVGGIVGEWIVTNANQINGDSYILSYANDFTVTGSGSYAGGIAGKLDASGCTTDLTYLGLYTNGKAVTGSDNVMDVVGVNYVGALFGAFIGNGYHYDADNSGVRSVILVKSLDDIRANVFADGDGVGYVMGGLIGYAEKVGILIGCDWTSETMSATNGNTIAKTGVYVNAKGVTSFVGGLVGVLGENATIESVKQEVAVVGGTATISGGQYSVVNKIAINGKDFVGGLIGYIASSAGSYFGTTGTILGNSIKFYNEAAVSGANYVGGIVGGLGIVDGYASFIGSDSDDVLKNLLSATLNSKQSILGYSTLESDPYTQNPFGKLINVANVTGSGNYVGGIFGYVGDRVSLTLENAPISTAMNAGELDTPYGYLNVYNGNSGLTGGSAITVKGSQYVGGIAGWLDNQAHDLTFVVNRSYVNGTTYAGGLVGYMRAGTITSSIAVAPDDVTASTNTYIGTTYIGGLVGYVDHGTISGSMSTGFSFGNVNANNGGIIGNGISPTIENTWTIYVAKDATYSTVSTNGRGKYLLLDSTVENVPSILQIARMTGLYVADMTYLGNTYTVGKLLVNVSVPSASNNKQLAFYDVSGSDNVTDNMSVDGSGNVTATNFTKFGNFDTSDPNALTIEWTFDNANSFSVCTVAIEFVNIPNYKDTNYNQNTAEGRKNAQDAYREPSASKLYVADVTNAEYWWYKDGDSNKGANNEGQIKKLTAVIYFKYANTLVKVGETGNYRIGDYDKDYSNDSIGSKENPIIISTQAQWNEFAYSVYTGQKDYKNQYIRLTTDITISNGTHNDTNGNKLDFTAETTPNKSSSDSKNAKSNLGYNFAGNISQGGDDNLSIVTVGGVRGKVTSAFKGTFEGNGHRITIRYNSGGYHRISAFPNANASFYDLTIDGYIYSGNNSSNSGYDIAAFVSKASGKIELYNCTNNASIQGLRNTAGFTGYVSSHEVIIKGCVNNGNVTTYETPDNSDTYKPKYYNYGTGGIVACSDRSITIESCINNGKIVAPVNVGGIIGRVSGDHTDDDVRSESKLYLYNCANTGEVYSNFKLSDDQAKAFWPPYNKYYGNSIWCNAGGLVGFVTKSASLHAFACYNSGYVHGIGNVVGGIVGTIGDHNGILYRTPNTRAKFASEIVYCYNTGVVEVGYDGVNEGNGVNIWGTDGDKYCSSVVGGIAGVIANGSIKYCYNTGTIECWGGVGVKGAYHSRAGGIVGESTANSQADSSWTRYVSIENSYNIGKINIYTDEQARYSSGILGFLNDDDAIKNSHVTNCFTMKDAVYKKSNGKYYDIYSDGTGSDSAKSKSGSPIALEDFTAVRKSDGTVAPIGSFADVHKASIETLTNDSAYFSGTAAGYIYLPGCLPQLAVFAIDTHNGLSMRSVNYGQNIYEDYEEQKAGDKYSPYIIKDGIDLLGLQCLVDLGYTFEGKFVEFANATNNIKNDGSNQAMVSSIINMPTYESTAQKLNNGGDAYKSSTATGSFTQTGKNYHLFLFGAVCSDGRNTSANSAYTNWLSRNYYYNQSSGGMSNKATFSLVNFTPIGRKGGSNIFKGNISGKQADGTNTEVANLRIVSSGSDYAFAGLFARVESANISYISVSGSMKAYGTYVAGHSIVGGIAADTSGNTVIDHCNAGTTSRSLTLEAHGKNDAYYSGTVDQLHTYAGGIVGIANTSFYTGSKHEYRAGTTSVIKNCNTVYATIRSAKNNIGGVVGYASATSLEGTSNADGKNNKIEITDNVVTSANLSAFTASGTGNSDIGTKVGGVLGYSDEYIAVVISGCTVGTDSTTASVTITGENAIGGIAGAMPNAINEIKDCAVKASTLIQRRNSWGVVENVSDKSAGDGGDHGTAIGGIVGYTYHNSAENAVTTTLSGNISFAGKINIDYPTQNDAVRNVGGIFGDMASGASFATGAVINVTGTISVKDTIKTDNNNAERSGVRNIGGVAGRTRDVAFSGDFTVSANIVIPNAYNVGGFIGRNRGEVNTLADNTVIKIGGTLEGSHGVGGFIGNNDADNGAILYIGANEYRRTRYEKPLSIEISQGATISASGDNVGGIVGNNASVDGTGIGSIQIVKGSITNNGTVKGANAVGGIIGNNNAGLVTGGGTGSDAVKKLTIVNGGAVSGNNYVGGVIGKLNRGTIAGTFVNNGDVTGKLFVGGSIGYVAFDAVITVAGGVATEFKNGAKEDVYTASGDALTADGDTVAQGVGSVSGEAYVGGSIGILLGKIAGTAEAKVIFTSSGKVNATAAAGYLGGSIGALAGEVSYTQFISSGDNMSDIDAITAVGGSVGFIGAPTPLLKANCNKEYAIDLSDVKITVVDSHFESNGNVKLTGNSAQIAEAKKNDDGSEKGEFEWGGVGGAIGVIAGVSNGFNGGNDWKDNTYYAEGNVTAPGIYNVGGIVGFIRANGIKINNLLAYDITVDGATNVGGIIGSTIGTGTVIEYAFSISSTDGTGLFTASDERGQAGGIIGKAASDTDASTSYWVKGYKNAELAGTDASRLKDTLGLYTAITEKIQNSDGTYTTVIFTKELVGTTAEDGSAVTENAVYPTPYDYIDAVGAHTVNGKNVTLEDTYTTDETTGAITKRDWKWYFETYYTNAEFANDTWVLKKPNWKAYSTGTEQTGWYFVYANDTVTDDIVGTVDAAHKSATAANLNDKDFWKRIANAYTNEERKNGDDVREIYSTIVSSIDADNTVSGGGLLLENNLYATATAANENKSGYYLYIASSGTSRPTAIHGTNDDKFYIQINTAIDKTTIAKNVAVYYRSFAMGSALTYNGYLRFAPISLQKDILAEPGITDGKTDASKNNTYAYSTTLVGTTEARYVGSYKSNVFVYYYDDAGKAYKVGGIKEGQWKIKQRSLTFSATSVNNKVYGDKDIESKVTIQNVAPNDKEAITFVLSIKGVDTPITISDLKAGKTYSAKDYQGIEITLVTASQDGSLSGTDANFIAETITDKSTYKIEFNIKFTNAKKYEISTSLAEGLSKTNYVMSNTDQNVEVKKRRIDVKIDSNNKSVFFDGKYNHGTTWTFSNIADAAYGDTWQSVLKAFSPLFVADIEKDGGGYNTYTSDLVNDKSLTYNGVTLQYDGLSTGRITFTGAGDVGNYYLRFSNYGQNDANNTSNYYINLTDGESESYAVSKNMLNITWSSSDKGKHVYDKSTIGTITASVVADHEIADFKSFVETYFTREWAGTKGETEISVASNNSTTATITFRTAVNAGTYTAKLAVNKQTHQDKINCSYKFINGKPGDGYSTFDYIIDKRPFGVSFEYSKKDGIDYIYNTYAQGLTGVRVTTLNGNANSGLVSGDTVSLKVTVTGKNVLVSEGYAVFSITPSFGTSTKTLSPNTIDVGDYTVETSLTSSTNYQFSGASDTWSIKQYSLSLGGLADGSKVYDGEPFKPTLNINGNTVNDGAYTYNSDTITVKYTATSTAGSAFVNVGEYNVSIGGSNAISAKRGSKDTTPNYKVDGTSSAKYTITPRTITLTWETIAEFVFNASAQGLKLAGATSDAGGKVALRSGGSITSAQITGYAGGDVIHISISGGKVNVNDTPATMSASIASVSGTNSDGSNSIAENYVLANEVSGEYKITPSELTIAYSSGSVNKVYDATRSADVSGLTFSVTSTNGGASISQSSFTITGVYDDKNVGYGTKTVTVTFVFNDDSGNYKYVGEETLDIAKVGTINPKELEVKLDKLRSGKATRVYNGDTLYGGVGAVYSGGTSARSAVYRSGEGFVVNGFPTAEQSGTVTISANYKEAETKRSMFDSYVNFVYGDDANGYQKGTYTSGYFKTLVFSISGNCAQNYTFKVTNGSEAYSDTVGSATQTVTVYDSRDEQNKDKRPSSAGNINIEITVKSFKVEYTNTSQSYANSDNTYNTDWKPVEATKTPDGTKVTVLNGWMYENGESGAMKVYKAYTVIRGRMGYKQLSAQVSGEKGMELNYNMSNQPILTIGYFVDNTDFEIGSIASLMIASYYWYASQHQDAPDFNPIISAGSDWISIVTNTDYGTGDFKDNKPTDAPEDCNSWDDYFAYIEQKENVTVFLNEYEGNSWGYYKTTQSTSDKTYTSFKQTADISGIVTQTDIEILNSFFTVYTFADDGTATTVQKTWGVGGEYITNFAKPSVGNVLTAIGSVFVSTADGFGGTYNGNGYVIEYLNIFGYAGAEQNVGMFDKIGNGSVSGLHLRNVTISANGGNVGGIAGEILAGEASNVVSNVSFHGSITVSGIGNVGGLFGKSARNIDKAIVLGTTTANGGNVAGVVGSMSGKLSNVVSLMQVDASGTVAPIANGGTVDNVFYLANAVWSKDGNGTISFAAGGNGTEKSYVELMNGSISGYGANRYYYSAADSTGNAKGAYDVIDDVAITSIDVEQKSNPRQSMRLRDVVDVYLLMYSLSETTATESGIAGAKTYTISATSWLVGSKHGTSKDDAIVIANKQNVALLRQLRFATFILQIDLSTDGLQQTSGAFYGTIYQNKHSIPSDWLTKAFANVEKATVSE